MRLKEQSTSAVIDHCGLISINDLFHCSQSSQTDVEINNCG